MKRNFLLALFAMLLWLMPQNLYAETCRVCGGSGQKYIPGMSTYGISTKKVTCPRCGKTFTQGSSHVCKCSACNGTGDNGRIRNGSVKTRTKTKTVTRTSRQEKAAANATYSNDPNFLINQTNVIIP